MDWNPSIKEAQPIFLLHYSSAFEFRGGCIHHGRGRGRRRSPNYAGRPEQLLDSSSTLRV